MTALEFYQYVIHFAVMMTIMTTMALYLLVSKRNAFGSEVVTDQRLRRKAGWMIMIYVLVYLANIPLAYWLRDDVMLLEMTSVTLDMMLCVPTVLHLMIGLLQDRRRWDNRLWWLSVVAVMPLAGWLLTGDAWWRWVSYGLYLTELGVFSAWYIMATKTYRRFLADNYADLEHKELVWSWLILTSMALSIVNQMLMWIASDINVIKNISYAFHIADTIFIGMIVWYIDHQQVLEPLVDSEKTDYDTDDNGTEDCETVNADTERNSTQGVGAPQASKVTVSASKKAMGPSALAARRDIINNKTGALLKTHCEDTQLYLQHDLSLNTVAQACHTNRTYLSLYFASQGTTYYMYINQLRIAHFQKLCREALKEKNTPPRLQQLSVDSGFQSYNTFSRAFMAINGMSISQWMERVRLEV